LIGLAEDRFPTCCAAGMPNPKDCTRTTSSVAEMVGKIAIRTTTNARPRRKREASAVPRQERHSAAARPASATTASKAQTKFSALSKLMPAAQFSKFPGCFSPAFSGPRNGPTPGPFLITPAVRAFLSFPPQRPSACLTSSEENGWVMLCYCPYEPWTARVLAENCCSP
jgi:hypothetical protein